MAQPADVNAARSQFLICVPLLKALSPMNGLGNQVVKSQRIFSPAQFASFRIGSAIPPAFATRLADSMALGTLQLGADAGEKLAHSGDMAPHL